MLIMVRLWLTLATGKGMLLFMQVLYMCMGSLVQYCMYKYLTCIHTYSIHVICIHIHLNMYIQHPLVYMYILVTHMVTCSLLKVCLPTCLLHVGLPTC